MANCRKLSIFIVDIFITLEAIIFITLGAIMIPAHVLNIVKQYNNATGGVALVYPNKGGIALVYPNKGLISLKKCRPIKWQDAVKKMESTINSNQYDTAVRGMGYRDTGNHLGAMASCENYLFCACDLE